MVDVFRFKSLLIDAPCTKEKQCSGNGAIRKKNLNPTSKTKVRKTKLQSGTCTKRTYTKYRWVGRQTL